LKKDYFSSHKLPKQQSTSFWSQGILGVKLQYVPTNDMTADTLTKSLPQAKHMHYMFNLGMFFISDPIHQALMTYVKPYISPRHWSHLCGSSSKPYIDGCNFDPSWSGRYIRHANCQQSKTSQSSKNILPYTITQNWLQNVLTPKIPSVFLTNFCSF
jgi:hypothetical protein